MMEIAKIGAIPLLIALVTPRYPKMKIFARHTLLYGYAVMTSWAVSAIRRKWVLTLYSILGKLQNNIIKIRLFIVIYLNIYLQNATAIQKKEDEKIMDLGVKTI